VMRTVAVCRQLFGPKHSGIARLYAILGTICCAS
jgi:hypothetical protein